MSKPFIFRAWMIRQIRKASYNYPPFYKIEAEAKTTYYIDSKNGKKLKRVSFKCIQCKNQFKRGEINRDHIKPVIDPLIGFPKLPNGEDDWNTYIKAMFFNDVQMLCIACHNDKTLGENAIRTKIRQTKKKGNEI